jgi:uncharacterized protein with HEPN domain
MSPSQPEFLRHMLDESSFIIEVVKNKTKEDITSDATLNRALIRSLEIIGEASKRVDSTFKTKYMQIDWREMARMRDKLIHDYFGVDYDIVYSTVKNDIPELHHELQRIIGLEEGK